MERAAGTVAAERREIERLGDHAFAGEGRVAVHEDREHGGLIAHPRLPRHALVGTRRALENRIHELEMARVRHEHDLELLSGHLLLDAGAEVVLHVAGVVGHGARVSSLELAEDRGQRLVEHVREDVDAATVRHADDRLTSAVRRRVRDRLIDERDERVVPLDRKALDPEEGAAEELLEPVHLDEALEDGALLVRRGGARHLAALDLLAEPLALGLVLDVLELDAERAGVDRAQALDGVEGGVVVEPEGGAGDRAQVVLADPVELGRQLGGAERWRPQRIELDGEVAVLPDRLHQPRRAGDFAERRGGGDGGLRAAAQALGELEELTPGGVDGGGIALKALEQLRDVRVVECARDR